LAVSVRAFLAVVAAAGLAGCAGVGAQSSAAPVPASAGDLELLLREFERIHPDPYHQTTKAQYRAIVDEIIARLPTTDENTLLVELMRLVALLGERDGHASLSPLSTAHRRELHLFPFWSYRFPEGLHVVGAVGRPDLVGKKIVAVEGRPIDDVLRLVEPLTPRDNEWSLKSRSVLPLVTAEVLQALGVIAAADRATFTLEAGNGSRRDVELRAVSANAYTSGLRRSYPAFINGLPRRSRPLFVSRRGTQQWLTTLQGGRSVYLAYNLTMNDTHETSERLLRLARRSGVRRVIVDLRNNPGGEIRTYAPLLQALQSRTVRRKRLIVLTSRATFSAAVHFAADVKRTTRALFLGEPTGGAPNHYSDTDPVTLPTTGWVVGVPTVWYEKLPGQSGLTIEPHRRIELTAAEFFAGRDPVLGLALTAR
jgi:hypothetical protein